MNKNRSLQQKEEEEERKKSQTWQLILIRFNTAARIGTICENYFKKDWFIKISYKTCGPL